MRTINYDRNLPAITHPHYLPALSSSSTTTVTWATTTTPSATATLPMANLQFTKFPAPVPWINLPPLSSSEPTHPNQSNIVKNNTLSFPSNSSLRVHPSLPFSLFGKITHPAERYLAETPPTDGST